MAPTIGRRIFHQDLSDGFFRVFGNNIFGLDRVLEQAGQQNLSLHLYIFVVTSGRENIGKALAAQWCCFCVACHFLFPLPAASSGRNAHEKQEIKCFSHGRVHQFVALSSIFCPISTIFCIPKSAAAENQPQSGPFCKRSPTFQTIGHS